MAFSQQVCFGALECVLDAAEDLNLENNSFKLRLDGDLYDHNKGGLRLNNFFQSERGLGLEKPELGDSNFSWFFIKSSWHKFSDAKNFILVISD